MFTGSMRSGRRRFDGTSPTSVETLDDRDGCPLRSTIWAFFVSMFLLSSFGCAGSKSGSEGTEPGVIQLALGRDGTKATSPDLSIAALRSGQAVFSIEGAEGATYTLSLTQDQIADLVSGSTVMTEVSGDRGAEPVRISVEKESKKGFLGVGW